MSKLPPVKKRKTYDLRLTKFELLHLRDLFSVVLPPEGKKTLSQALAELENRSMIESLLWNKISNVCQQAELPVDQDAPDYVVAPAAPPPLTVFQLASEPDLVSEDQEESAGFIKDSGD